MSWNYRIVRHHDCLMLHEVHYHEDGSVRSYTADPATFVSDLDQPDDIAGGLRLALEAASTLPVLDAADLPGGDEPEPNDPFLRHEALDRASMLAGLVERELLDHPAVRGNPALRDAVQRGVDALGVAYQVAGQPPV